MILFTLARIVAIIMLFLSLDKQPYGYYTVLRFIVCGVGVYGAWLSYSIGKHGWLWLLGIIALLFNPIIPIHFTKGFWSIIDIGVAIIFLGSFIFFKKPKKEREGKITMLPSGDIIKDAEFEIIKNNNATRESIIDEEVKTSVKRIIGAAFFGLILGSCLSHASSFVIPRILHITQEISIDTAIENYESSSIISFIATVVMTFFAAGIAGFIARRKGILAGILSNIIYMLIWGGLLIASVIMGSDVMIGNISGQLYSFILLLSLVLTSILGGILGGKIYSPEKDLDLGNNKLTVFGVRWFHYFWIIPLFFYPFLCSLIYFAYAVVLSFLVEFYFAIHPSLWINCSWWIYFMFIPALNMIALLIVYFGFIRFYKVMQYKQIESRGWKKFGQILLYCVGAPMLSCILSSLLIFITYRMPKPIEGDWKIGLLLILIFPTIGILIAIFSWIKSLIKDKIF
ncbi:MAG: YrzE family protein [Planctomycetota bacterium]